jgi:cytoskeletal protein CcmA (bactofilin family)
MWKRDSQQNQQGPAQTEAKGSLPVASVPDRDRAPRPSVGAVSCISASTTFEGTVSGAEDLLVDGRLVGDVSLTNYAVTVGAPGKVKGHVDAKSIVIEGEVEGNLKAVDQIVVRNTGRVEGDLFAPRITLQDGCSFQGSIDMSAGKQEKPAAVKSERVKEAPTPQAARQAQPA